MEHPAIWFQASACSGCVVSVLNGVAPSIRDLVVDQLAPGHHVSLRFQPTVMAGSGDAALEVLAPWVRGVHCKDGEWPERPGGLGVEKPLGEGRVNFPVLISKLKALGYEGALTIEREISGPQQTEDIKKAKLFLERLR